MNPVIDTYGNKKWFNEEGILHRTDGPAVIWEDGTCFWMINNRFHREDGPAIIWGDKLFEYYIHGKEYTEDDFTIKMRNDRIKSILNMI
jgi:hypothetical protein